MSVEKYKAELHTPDALASQIDALPENFVLAGSIGRCVLMGLLKPLKKPDGKTTDIDVIDITGQSREVRIATSNGFPLDAMLTRTLRPHEGKWGLFFDGYEEPHTEIDPELCVPQLVAIPWKPDCTTEVLPVGIQAALIDIKAPYRKNKIHAQQFLAFADAYPLPFDVQRDIDAFKQLNWEFEKKHHHGKRLTKPAQLYKRVNHLYRAKCPGVVQRVVEVGLGDTIRKVRRATIEL